MAVSRWCQFLSHFMWVLGLPPVMAVECPQKEGESCNDFHSHQASEFTTYYFLPIVLRVLSPPHIHGA